MNLVLHIGVSKTGSTAIQKSLGKNGSLLGRVYVPGRCELPLVGGGHHKGLGYVSGSKRFWGREGLSMIETLLEGEKKEVVECIRKGDVGVYRKIFIDSLKEVICSSKANHCDTVLLSSELLSEIYSANDVRSVCEIFDVLFDRVRVIVYLREQVSAYVSLYAQNLKGGNSFSFQKFLEVSGAKHVFDYQKLIQKWSALDWQMVPRIYYERRQAPIGWSLLNDFEEAVLGESEGRLNNCIGKKSERLNVSAGADSLFAIRFFNQIGLFGKCVKAQKAVLWLANCFLGDTGRFLKNNKEAVDEIVSKHSDGNILVSQNFFNRSELFGSLSESIIENEVNQ